MKTAWMLLALPIAAFTTLALAEDPKPKAPDANATASLDHKIELLEQDLISTRQRAEETAAQLAETKSTLAATIRYLEAQAKADEALAAALDESEKAGFTFGINPESRLILLRGWRESLASSQKSLPVLPEPKAPAKNGAKPAEKSATVKSDAPAPK